MGLTISPVIVEPTVRAGAAPRPGVAGRVHVAQRPQQVQESPTVWARVRVCAATAAVDQEIPPETAPLVGAARPMR